MAGRILLEEHLHFLPETSALMTIQQIEESLLRAAASPRLLLQLRVLRLGFLQDGDIGVGVPHVVREFRSWQGKQCWEVSGSSSAVARRAFSEQQLDVLSQRQFHTVPGCLETSGTPRQRSRSRVPENG